uniref:Uncharacterized protein n=1 Tax=Heterorhabditis bacteriophora TaxID=37862 RepID=A0A1I7WQ24_HETBA
MSYNCVRQSRFQQKIGHSVGTEDVLRWSPVVWLVGVCIAGAFMNLIFYCQKKYKERKLRQRNGQVYP